MDVKSHNLSVIDGIIHYTDMGIDYRKKRYVINELIDHFQNRDSGFSYDYGIRDKGTDEHRKEIANVLIGIVLNKEEWKTIKHNPNEDRYIFNRAQRQRLIDEIFSKISEVLSVNHDLYKDTENFVMFSISRDDFSNDRKLSAKFAEINENIKYFDLDEKDCQKLRLDIFKITTKLQYSARPSPAAMIIPF